MTMKGLFVLDSFTQNDWVGFHWSWWALLIIIPISFAALFVAYIIRNNTTISLERFWESTAMIGVCILMSIIILLSTCNHRAKYMYIEATVDEEVGFIELTQQYDIIEQRGNLYVLRLKS